MGLDAYLEDEFGEELDSYEDEGGVLAAAMPTGDDSYLMLRFVDAEGTTVFNRFQALVAAAELERLEAVAGPKAQIALGRVLKMARRAAVEPHLYLRLLGD